MPPCAFPLSKLPFLEEPDHSHRRTPVCISYKKLIIPSSTPEPRLPADSTSYVHVILPFFT